MGWTEEPGQCTICGSWGNAWYRCNLCAKHRLHPHCEPFKSQEAYKKHSHEKAPAEGVSWHCLAICSLPDYDIKRKIQHPGVSRVSFRYIRKWNWTVNKGNMFHACSECAAYKMWEETPLKKADKNVIHLILTFTGWAAFWNFDASTKLENWICPKDVFLPNRHVGDEIHRGA